MASTFSSDEIPNRNLIWQIGNQSFWESSKFLPKQFDSFWVELSVKDNIDKVILRTFELLRLFRREIS